MSSTTPKLQTRNPPQPVRRERRRSRALLLFVCLGLAAVLTLLWQFVRRAPASGRVTTQPGAHAPSGVGAELRPAPVERASPRVSLAQDPGGERAAAALPAALAEPAVVAGRLTLDGAAPDGGRLRLCAADGSWEGAGVLDYEGRFRVPGVPAQELTLSFELIDLEPFEARQLLPPETEVWPKAGQTEPLELDWKTKHVNLRVVSDGPEGCRSRVHIEGPRYQTSIETDDEGKARLSLVGAGTFRFRAVQRSGREGEAVLELEADTDLDSVVITTTLPKRWR